MSDFELIDDGGNTWAGVKKMSDLVEKVEDLICIGVGSMTPHATARAVVSLVVDECAAEIDAYRKEYGGNWPALEKVAERVRNLTNTGGREDG